MGRTTLASRRRAFTSFVRRGWASAVSHPSRVTPAPPTTHFVRALVRAISCACDANGVESGKTGSALTFNSQVTLRSTVEAVRGAMQGKSAHT